MTSTRMCRFGRLLVRFFAEELKVNGLPNGIRATLTKTGLLLDITKSPVDLGLQPGDQVSLAWSTSYGGAAFRRPPAPCSTARTLRLSRRLLELTLSHLRAAAGRGTEGLCYWAAIPSGDAWTVVELETPSSQASWSQVDVSAEENQKIAEQLPAGATIVAQVHSHLGPAFHSPRDDRHPYSFEPGFLSIVVPWGARETVRWPGDVAVYELVHYPKWRRLSAQEVHRRVVILE